MYCINDLGWGCDFDFLGRQLLLFYWTQALPDCEKEEQGNHVASNFKRVLICVLDMKWCNQNEPWITIHGHTPWSMAMPWSCGSLHVQHIVPTIQEGHKFI